MSSRSAIEWTDRTWNPLTGCTKVSPGCDNCYAKTMHERFHGAGSFDTVELHRDRLIQPLTWKRPQRVFVNSMSDLFHASVPDEFIAKTFGVMAAARRHTFQVLTKRPARMRSLLNSPRFESLAVATTLHNEVRSRCDVGQEWQWPSPNIWLGTSVEDQRWADIRIPALLATPAAVRFLSCEPLLGPVDLFGPWGEAVECDDLGPALTHTGFSYPTDYGTGIEYDCAHEPGVDWVIVGGESGPGARPMNVEWARSLRDQCVAACVPFHFKQWGEYAPRYRGEKTGEVMQRVGKKAAGRELDGRTWDEYPERAA